MDNEAATLRPKGTALIGTTGEQSGRVLAIDHGLAELLDSTREALVGTRFCDHIHPEDRDRALDTFARLISHSTSGYEGTGRLIDANGAVHHVRASASVVASNTRLAIVLRIAALPA